ncbi:MAG: 4Fe-4S dicluster domain-containing protein [Candidatus Pacearchaeota archaeon]
MGVEIDNAKQAAIEIVKECFKCGLCRELCPVLRVEREEHYSPRGKSFIINNSNFEKIVYDCTLCKACEKKCPIGIKLCSAFIYAREVLVMQKKEIPENIEIIKNLMKTGNIYGVEEQNKENR